MTMKKSVLNSLASDVLDTLSQPVNRVWNMLTGTQQPLRARIVHRYAVPSSRTISVAEGFFGFIPVESYENERFILEVAYADKQYQVEVPRAYYQKSNIGDGIDIHTLCPFSLPLLFHRQAMLSGIACFVSPAYSSLNSVQPHRFRFYFVRYMKIIDIMIT